MAGTRMPASRWRACGRAVSAPDCGRDRGHYPGVDDEGVVIDFILFQGIKNVADIVVQFLNRITVFASIGFA